MRTITKISIILFVTIMAALQACKKYEEGPGLSLRSKEARVDNTWKLEKYLKNDADITAAFTFTHNNYSEIYSKEGIYSYTYVDDKNSSKSGAGNWEFQNDKMEIKRTSVSGQSTLVLHITKLKENAFWYWYMDGSDKIEMHLESN